MKVQIRDNSIEIEGYVNAVQRDSRRMVDRRGAFVEQIEAGSWKKALEREDSVRLLFNHDHKRELGDTKTNVELWEDNIGLKIRATISDEEVVESATKNKLTGFSFGFYALKQRTEPTTNDGVERRFIEDLKLTEVSLLSKTPAYFGTQVEIRGEEETLLEFRSVEDAQDEIECEEVQEVVENQEPEESGVDYRSYYEYTKFIIESRGR